METKHRKIDSQAHIFKHIILEEWRWISISLLIFLIAGLLVDLLILKDFIFSYFLIMLSVTIYIKIISNKAQARFMRSFAEAFNLKYEEKLDLRTLTGKLFESGESKSAYNVMVGSIENHPTKIFNYSYSVGSGKSRKTYSFTICELEIGKTIFPPIFLQSQSVFSPGPVGMFGNQKITRISLEENFSKKYALYCKEDYEIETLQIFTTEILTYLTENASHFSIEFAKNKIYIYDDVRFIRQEELEKIYTVATELLKRTDGLLLRLQNDFESLHEVYEKTT